MSSVNRADVEQFLKEFKEKKRFWGVLFLDQRGKNFETLASLEIRPIEREQVLDDLVVENYSQGPLPEEIFNGADMWVFGKMVKGKEIYIKITMGSESAKTLCISFHTAEHKMNYPFKS